MKKLNKLIKLSLIPVILSPLVITMSCGSDDDSNASNDPVDVELSPPVIPPASTATTNPNPISTPVATQEQADLDLLEALSKADLSSADNDFGHMLVQEDKIFLFKQAIELVLDSNNVIEHATSGSSKHREDDIWESTFSLKLDTSDDSIMALWTEFENKESSIAGSQLNNHKQTLSELGFSKDNNNANAILEVLHKGNKIESISIGQLYDDSASTSTDGLDKHIIGEKEHFFWFISDIDSADWVQIDQTNADRIFNQKPDALTNTPYFMSMEFGPRIFHNINEYSRIVSEHWNIPIRFSYRRDDLAWEEVGNPTTTNDPSKILHTFDEFVAFINNHSNGIDSIWEVYDGSWIFTVDGKYYRGI